MMLKGFINTYVLICLSFLLFYFRGKVMYLLVGLGNPGEKYEKTRHNIGFLVIDKLVSRWGFSLEKDVKTTSFVGKGFFKDRKVCLIKPMTFMNNSGVAIKKFVDFFKIELENILVIYDDLDLPLGKIRLRQQGSSGGHNGMKSVILHLATTKFKRLKIGIGRPKNTIPINTYVLQPFLENELVSVLDSLDKAVLAIETFILEDFNVAMTKFN